MDPLRVMVVDDEEGMRLGTARALRDHTVAVPESDETVGYEILQAGTGEDALEMIAESRPDILLLDHKLPGMSGLDVLEKIAAEEDPPLTIMITAYASLDTAITATKRGAHDFLPKPFTPGELRNAVGKASKHLLLTRQARQLAEERRQVRFQFISVLSHELKAPLAAIEGYLDLIASRTAGEDLASYDEMIQRCQVRLDGMKKLIFDLLDMTRIESGQKKREITRVNLTELARASVESFEPEARKRDITVNLHRDEPLEIAGDRGELEIIFNNLVSNAVKYNRDGGQVDIHIEEPDDAHATIRVSDTGIGMSPEETAKLFEDFVRIKNAKTRNITGSGLGLSTLKKLAQLYHGDVAVESEPDVGTTFTVTLETDSAQPSGDEN